MNLLDLMRQRRSVRRFKPDTPPDELLTRLIEAAITAPSPGNRQAWKFLIVTDKDVIETASAIVSEETSRLAALIDPDLRKDFARYAGNFSVFRNAPILIVPLYRPFSGLLYALGGRTDEKTGGCVSGLERDGALMSVSLAMQNILLMATDLGLGTCCMTGPLLAGDRLAVLFDLPEGWHMAAVLAVGFPDEKPADPGRKPLQTFIRRREANNRE